MTQVGHLLDGTLMRVLVDSGATKAMVNMNTYKRNKLLKEYPCFRIPTRKVRAANNQIMFCRNILKFPIKICGHVFKIIALLMPFTKEHDFIIGVKTMTELEATIDVARLEFLFRKRSIALRNDKTFSIPPQKTVVFKATMEETPPDLHDGYVVLKLNSLMEKGQFATIRTYVSKGTVQLKLSNESKVNHLSLMKGQKIRCVDMRSMGYAHLSGEVIQRLLGNRFIFYNKEGEVQTFHQNKEEEPKPGNSELIVKPEQVCMPTKAER